MGGSLLPAHRTQLKKIIVTTHKYPTSDLHLPAPTIHLKKIPRGISPPWYLRIGLLLNPLNVLTTSLTQSNDLDLFNIKFITTSGLGVLSHGLEIQITRLHEEAAAETIVTSYHNSLSYHSFLLISELSLIHWLPLTTIGLLCIKEVTLNDVTTVS